jgi:catalase
VSDKKRPQHLTHATGTPVTDNLNILTADRRGPALLQDLWLIEKLAHFDREVIPERRMHAKGAGAHGTFTVTHDITLDQVAFSCAVSIGSARMRLPVAA